jgi:ribosomal protein S18 acetylase RimI-like enzyme
VPDGYGFVDERTPELTIGVDTAARGRGVGTALLDALHRLAVEHGFEQLSLSVEPHNAARRLYERAGYREVGVDAGGSITMVKPLLRIREATAADVEAIRWALFAALDWQPERQLPPFDVVMQHPAVVRYHRDWGRPGDLGVLAELGGKLVGVAYARLFTDDDHGQGYVDEETPEVAVAVRDGHRGEGIGAQVMVALAELARERGVRQLSLSVDGANPAQRLYEGLGYRKLREDDGDLLMLLELR